MYDSLANTKLSDVLREQSSGDTINSHVVLVPIEPAPDYEAMRRAVYGDTPTKPKQAVE